MPVWLLDVDGVLNVTRPGWGGAPRQGTACSAGIGYRMRWSAELVSEIRRLHRSGTVEIRWATTWVDDIEQVERLLRLPPFPTAFSGLNAAPSVKAPGYKAEAALRIVEAERRPLIWTDDDAIPTSGPLIDHLAASGMPTMLMRPDPRRGLQPEDIHAIEEFIADLP
jgi:hypothetical protein